MQKGRLEKIFKTIGGKSAHLAQLICRPDWTYEAALGAFPEQVKDLGKEINEQIEMELKYAGYIERQKKEVEKLEHLDAIRIGKDFDYGKVIGIRTEARQHLSRFTPENLGQAARIPGVTPSDISVLMIALKRKGGTCPST